MEGVTMAETVIVRHPIRGLLWGLLCGIGLAFVLVFSTLMEFAVLPITVTIVIGLVFGVLWGYSVPPGRRSLPARAGRRRGWGAGAVTLRRQYRIVGTTRRTSRRSGRGETAGTRRLAAAR